MMVVLQPTSGGKIQAAYLSSEWLRELEHLKLCQDYYIKRDNG